MGFWKNVDDYIKFKDITRKELSYGTGIKSQTIDRAIQRDSEPKFAEGLKVCYFLNVPVEEFLDNKITLPNKKIPENQVDIKNQLHLYRKYHDLIQNCESIPECQQTSVRLLAQSLADIKPTYSASHNS